MSHRFTLSWHASPDGPALRTASLSSFPSPLIIYPFFSSPLSPSLSPVAAFQVNSSQADVPCPSTSESRWTAQRCPATAPRTPIVSATSSGIGSQGRTDRGSAGERARARFSTLPVSRYRPDRRPLPISLPPPICRVVAARPHTRILTSRHAGLNVFLVCVPIAWVSHFLKWESASTFTRM